MRRIASLVLTGALVAACAPGQDRGLSPDHVHAMRDSVTQFVESIPDGLAAGGPTSWLRFFESTPAFFMASDGQVAFPGYDSAQAFLDVFSRSVSGMELVWESLRVEPLAPGAAAVAAAYRESITDTAGATVSFGGYMTGVARNTAGAWRLQSLHWSSPAPPAEKPQVSRAVSPGQT